MKENGSAMIIHARRRTSRQVASQTTKRIYIYIYMILHRYAYILLYTSYISYIYTDAAGEHAVSCNSPFPRLRHILGMLLTRFHPDIQPRARQVLLIRVALYSSLPFQIGSGYHLSTGLPLPHQKKQKNKTKKKNPKAHKYST
jgi:hypothetical protein